MSIRIWGFILALALLNEVWSQVQKQEISTPKAGDLAPVFSLNSLTGERIFLRDYCGETLRQPWINKVKYPVVLSFFSTTCAPCKIEIGLLHRLAQKYPNRAKFLLIGVGEAPEKIGEYARAQNYSFPVLVDQYLTVSEKYGNKQTVPKLALVDENGKIVLFKEGYCEETITKLDNWLKIAKTKQ